MIDKFFSSSDEPFITIADIFGYILLFLIIWFLWTSYKAASNVAIDAKNAVVEKATPIVSEIKTRTNEVKLKSPEVIENIKEKKGSTFFKSILSSTKSHLSEISNTSPEDALQSINESLNSWIGNIGDDSTSPRSKNQKDSLKREKGQNKDALAPL